MSNVYTQSYIACQGSITHPYKAHILRSLRPKGMNTLCPLPPECLYFWPIAWNLPHMKTSQNLKMVPSTFSRAPCGGRIKKRRYIVNLANCNVFDNNFKTACGNDLNI